MLLGLAVCTKGRLTKAIGLYKDGCLDLALSSSSLAYNHRPVGFFVKLYYNVSTHYVERKPAYSSASLQLITTCYRTVSVPKERSLQRPALVSTVRTPDHLY